MRPVSSSKIFDNYQVNNYIPKYKSFNHPVLHSVLLTTLEFEMRSEHFKTTKITKRKT